MERIIIEGDNPVVVDFKLDKEFLSLEYRKAREILRESARTIG